MSKTSVALSRPAGNVLSRAPLRTDPPCIDLGKRFGQQYRVEYEPSYAAQYGPRARISDPWLRIIPCGAGHICPWGGSKLAAVTNKAGPTARKLAALPGAILWQDGGDGATVLFDVALFPQVARLMHPKRRRRPPTEAQLEALAKGRRPFGRIPVDKHAPEGRPCVQTLTSDSEAVPAGSAISAPCGASF